ncbi:MAG TPA: efflux RND transporter periplasmic adaptor subunit [Gammaproteobacteria bacterium]
MKLRFRTVFWIAAAVVVAVLLLNAFRPQPVPVDVAETSRGSMLVTVRDEGRTRVRDEYIVSAPVAGRLLRIELEPGAHVHAGDVVARIVPGAPAFLDARAEAEARAAVEAAEAALAAAQSERRRAEAQLEFARADEQRIENLRGRDLASVEALDRARLEVRLAEGALAAAEENLRARTAELEAARSRLLQPGGEGDGTASVDVLAPVDGRVLRVMRESEAVVPVGAELLSLGDPDDLEIVVEMLSTDAVHVERGAKVIIEDYGRDAPPLEGRVRLVEPYGFTKISALGVEEQRVNVIVDFVAPPAERPALAHGFRVEAAVVTWSADDVLRVPVSALFRSGGRWAVFRAIDDTARLTLVEVGRNNGEYAEVLSGLEAGETVVLYPGERVTDGTRIRRRN